MSAPKPTEDKDLDPKETIRVNISLTRGTSDILKKLADHKHLTVSAAVTCLVRTKAEEVGILPRMVEPEPEKTRPMIAALKSPRKKANGTAMH